ncbi:DUF89 domain-containing protein [Thelephora ganbajun]|uniref:DUF89 domain-containing protein n=1 Tax=Thelephora ganbajun TaxID=370292 RepID=A0ACB6ZFE8_THEGA|nr:DUF89 domain-containing protein [Thelephora ganbajun]
MFDPPYPPYDPTDTKCFSYDTLIRRWPVILTTIIDHLYRVGHELATEPNDLSPTVAEERIEAGKAIIEKISKLKYEMGRDKPLLPITDDGEPSVGLFNQELAALEVQGKNTWFTAPWLYAECYLYRLLRGYFIETKVLEHYDPFASQKIDTFRKSGNGVYQLASSMHEMEIEKDKIKSDPAKLSVLFKEMTQICLWGNATDLSLLTHMTLEDINRLQGVGREAQESRKQFILHDDQEAVWSHVQNLKNARVDLVLDNAGFELFTDLVFADFLVTCTPYVSKVVFHPKLIPWFVSDVTPPDFSSAFPSLLDPSFFGSAPSEEAKEHLEIMATRWSNYITDGTFSLSVPKDTPLGGKDGKGRLAVFWTTPYPYWDMQERDQELWNDLRDSSLVVFKGDLKLTGDIQWPASTPFEKAIGPLAGSFPILSLRTNKADVVVGVDQDIANKLDLEDDRKWRYDGRYALISFVPKSF